MSNNKHRLVGLLLIIMLVISSGASTVGSASSVAAPKSSEPTSQAGMEPLKMVNPAQATDLLKQSSVRFEANQGQFDPAVRYLVHGAGYTMYLTDQGQVFSLGASQNASAPTLRFELLGGNQQPTLGAVGELPGKTNYLLGSDESRWVSNVANYQRVVYRSVYPGVDLAYYGTEAGALEHDFVVAAGTDPAIIRQRISGAQRLEIANRDLV